MTIFETAEITLYVRHDSSIQPEGSIPLENLLSAALLLPRLNHSNRLRCEDPWYIPLILPTRSFPLSLLESYILTMSKPGDFEAVRKDIVALLHQPEYDDGSAGPVLVRLAW